MCSHSTCLHVKSGQAGGGEWSSHFHHWSSYCYQQSGPELNQCLVNSEFLFSSDQERKHRICFRTTFAYSTVISKT